MDEYSDTVHRKAGDNVIFTGFVDDEILAGLYSRSDLYVTCSVSEGWGLPISEANRFGTPIVAFNSVPAVNSIENVFLAKNGDQEDFKRQFRRAIAEVHCTEQ
jgi:1,2-diacylglycerol 3-alpha-glucosyltransferase